MHLSDEPCASATGKVDGMSSSPHGASPGGDAMVFETVRALVR